MLYTPSGGMDGAVELGDQEILLVLETFCPLARETSKLIILLHSRAIKLTYLSISFIPEERQPHWEALERSGEVRAVVHSKHIHPKHVPRA